MKCHVVTLWSLALCIHSGAAYGQDGVVGSPHDLSAVSGLGTVHATHEEQVCVFCHAPHNAAGSQALWNRRLRTFHYRIYESSTTDARIDQPTGPSKMCLSCHDGAIALGLVASRPATEPIVMTQRTMPPGPSDLTEDLSDDHPIGFRYDRALAFRDPQLKNPDLLTPELPLGAHGEMHCTTCHDPHNNRLGNFLRTPDVRSAICLSCHDLHGWTHSSHATSGATVVGRSLDPRERTPYHTVADNACASCHKIHGAAGRERLLRHRREEDNCLNCHDGGVARTNIESDLRKASAHPVDQFTDRHDPDEGAIRSLRHVECADCHNPHATRAAAVDTPFDVVRLAPTPVGPTEQFVVGVSRTGRAVDHARFRYEICFKCHADHQSRTRVDTITRQITQTNTRLEFQPNNPSFHPVIGPRGNNDVVSLIPPLRVGAVIACTDCHNSDTAGSASGASGPHGSIHNPLLRDNYSTDDFTLESAQSYALCYRCHDRQSILGDESFPLHNIHVVRGRAPCSACHDAHGVSRTQGDSRRHASLINFDLSIVRPATGGLGSRVEFNDTGPFRGNCTLACHGVTHVRFEYER